MKKLFTISLIVILCCALLASCTPDKQDATASNPAIPGPVQPGGATDHSSEHQSGSIENQEGSPLNSGAEGQSALQNETDSPASEDWLEEEQIPDEIVVDIGEDVGVGGN